MLTILRLGGFRPALFSSFSQLSPLYARQHSQDSSVKPFNAIPGPKPFPFGIGNIREGKELSQGKVRDDYPISRLTKEYGNIYKLYFGGEAMVVVNDADYVQTVFRMKARSLLEALQLS